MLTKITPSYLYQQYNDDDNLQGFVAAQNALAQGYLDWYNKTPLPVYTDPAISGRLLDLVASGLYGMVRPTLPYGRSSSLGALNTYTTNRTPLNSLFAVFKKIFGRIGIDFAIGISPVGVLVLSDAKNFVTSDDTFKRIMTWNLFRGDGRNFNIRWLKRRVKRFLTGQSGTDPGIDETYDVRVVLGPTNLINIICTGGTVKITGQPVCNKFACNRLPPNGTSVTYSTSRGKLLRAAILSGVLQVPFQYRYQVYG